MYSPESMQAAHVSKVIQICQMVPTVLTCYDYLLTLQEEIELVWNKPWTLAKSLFLWNRYSGIIFLLVDTSMFSVRPTDDAFCKRWFICLGWSTAVIVWSMQSTMLFRTFAMYPHSGLIRWAACIFFLVEILSMSIILLIAFPKFHATVSPAPGVIFCTPNIIPTFLYAFWIPVIVFDCVLFLLAVWIIIRRRIRDIPDLPVSPVWKTLVRDSICYFCITLLAYVTNAVLWVAVPGKWLGLPQAFSIAGTCIMGVRLVLNLRGAYYYPWMIDENGRVVPDPEETEDDGDVSLYVFSRMSTRSKQENQVTN